MLVILFVLELIKHNWLEALSQLGALTLVTLLMLPRLARVVRVTDEGIDVERWHWWNTSVRFAEVERLYVPMTRLAGLQFFTDTRSNAALSISENDVDRYDDLLRRVADRLPESAEIEDPGGRLEPTRAETEKP